MALLNFLSKTLSFQDLGSEHYLPPRAWSKKNDPGKIGLILLEQGEGKYSLSDNASSNSFSLKL